VTKERHTSQHRPHLPLVRSRSGSRLTARPIQLWFAKLCRESGILPASGGRGKVSVHSRDTPFPPTCITGLATSTSSRGTRVRADRDDGDLCVAEGPLLRGERSGAAGRAVGHMKTADPFRNS
jgi:hypothetical protein